MSNLTRYKFDSISVECEIQTANLRIFDNDTGKEIGVCTLNAVCVSEAIPKMLFIDSGSRAKSSESIKAVHSVAKKLGFRDKVYQRKKHGKFIKVER